MRLPLAFHAGLAFALASSSVAAQAPFDPRQPLFQLINAFQNCGPAATYQMLSPQLAMLVSQQTGGMGCYSFMRNAGPVVDMQVIESRQFPIGPMYAIRVIHQAGPVDWYIGFNQVTGRVEALTFKAVASGAPPPVIGAPPVGGGSGGGTPTPPPRQGGGGGAGCDLYPAMCQDGN